MIKLQYDTESGLLVKKTNKGEGENTNKGRDVEGYGKNVEISFTVIGDATNDIANATIGVRMVFDNLKDKKTKEVLAYGETFLESADNLTKLKSLAQDGLTNGNVPKSDHDYLNSLIKIVDYKLSKIVK